MDAAFEFVLYIERHALLYPIRCGSTPILLYPLTHPKTKQKRQNKFSGPLRPWKDDSTTSLKASGRAIILRPSQTRVAAVLGLRRLWAFAGDRMHTICSIVDRPRPSEAEKNIACSNFRRLTGDGCPCELGRAVRECIVVPLHGCSIGLVLLLVACLQHLYQMLLSTRTCVAGAYPLPQSVERPHNIFLHCFINELSHLELA